MASLTGIQKARVFLSLLGEQALTKIVRYLPGTYADRLQKQLSENIQVTPELIQKVVEEFTHFSSLPPHPPGSGGRPAPTGGGERGSRHVAKILARERPQMVAFILKRVLPELKEVVLGQLAEKRERVESSLSTLEWVPLSDRVEEKLKTLLAQELSGPR